MSHRKFWGSFPWTRYSKKLSQKIERPLHVGAFNHEDAKERGMRLAIGMEGSTKEGNQIRLYWLVDPNDGVIADAKFQVFGQSALIGAAEAACELLIRKNYDQARRISAELIDKQFRDKDNLPAFPEETYPHINLVIDAIEHASSQCLDIPFAEVYVPTPIAQRSGGEASETYPGWDTLSNAQKLEVIEAVIAQDIRPYIELDAGGVRVISLVDNALTIAYEGACTTCYSATGATLEAIQHQLRMKIDPHLMVIPDLATLSH